jgi:hypothetical protein
MLTRKYFQNVARGVRSEVLEGRLQSRDVVNLALGFHRTPSFNAPQFFRGALPPLMHTLVPAMIELLNTKLHYQNALDAKAALHA